MFAAAGHLRRVACLLLVGLVLAAPVRARQDDAEAPPAPAAARADRAEESMLGWMVRASGLIGLVILGMSFYLVAVVVWMFLNFRRSVALPSELLDEVAGLLGRKQYEAAYHRLVSDRSFLARALAPAVRRLSSGLPAAQRALELANEDVTMEMEHRTTYLATVGTLGPMIGLVGTVYGMIRSFQAIATMGASPQATELAKGISTALFATLEGILLSVPAIAFYALFRNRIARLSLEVQVAAEALLDQFAPGVRPVHPLVPTGRAALPPKD
jgi:biopolymer transport protein ExbB